MDESFDLLKCNEDLSSSPGCHMEYGKIPKQPFRCKRNELFLLCQVMSVSVDLPSDDMPDLQEVEEDQRSPGLFHVGSGVSHQEFGRSSSTNWLAELANIATSPQSPLLKNAPHKRCDAYIHMRMTQR